MHSRKPKRRIESRKNHRKAEGPVECVLSRLHITEEIGEVHDSGHVRLGKFDPSRRFELKWHNFQATTVCKAERISLVICCAVKRSFTALRADVPAPCRLFSSRNRSAI